MWTPESAAEHPEAVHQLGVEFARAGADVTQTFSFWCHEDKLPKGCKFSVSYPGPGRRRRDVPAACC